MVGVKWRIGDPHLRSGTLNDGGSLFNTFGNWLAVLAKRPTIEEELRCIRSKPPNVAVGSKREILVQAGYDNLRRHERRQHCRSDRSRRSRVREVSIVRRHFVSQDQDRSSSARFWQHHPFQR
jgi:hypothetical protein